MIVREMWVTSTTPPAAEDNRNLMNTKARWFVRGMLVGIALTLALNFVLTQ